MAADEIHFLSVDGETGEASRLPKAKLLEAIRQWRGAGRRLRYGIPADDLSQAGWGIVLPADGDSEIREALAPLVRRRREETGDRFQELTYRRREGPGEFRSRLRSGFGQVNPDQIPYYLLLVGDADQIPHGFQAGLDVPHAVGRLHLSSIEAYARYAESVVKVEESSAAGRPKIAVFSPSHESDEGTQHCVERLACGLVEFFTGRAGGQLDRALIGRAATRKAFLDLLAIPEASLILTAGHGVMYAAGHNLQRRLQGSLVCADWTGAGRVQMDHLIEPSILPPTTDLAGKLLFLFGCFTGGTPRLDGYDPAPRDRRRVLAEAPFVANLPQALLERGVLAVVAHIDQAYSEAFLWEKYGQVEVFQDCLASMLDGHRVGFALEGFADRYAHIATEMVEAREELGDGDFESLGLRLWTAYNDARGMVVLGDPAVRLATRAASPDALP